MTERAFISIYGDVYEHSAWVAQAAWRQGISDLSVNNLARVLAAQVKTASRKKQLQLIKEHPDLAGRAALRGELTTESTAEQASAGIDQCSAGEFSRFEMLNAKYKKKFDFPFIMAVKGSNRIAILDAFVARVENDYNTEFATAIDEIHKIARFRLEDIGNNSSNTECVNES